MSKCNENPGTPLDFAELVASAVAFRNREAVLSTLAEATNFYHAGKGLYER